MSTEPVSASVALVTGADTGIGLETARRLRRAGRGHLDVLVNNAGITGPMRDPHDYTADASPKRSHFSPAAKAALHARD